MSRGVQDARVTCACLANPLLWHADGQAARVQSRTEIAVIGAAATWLQHSNPSWAATHMLLSGHGAGGIWLLRQLEVCKAWTSPQNLPKTRVGGFLWPP